MIHQVGHRLGQHLGRLDVESDVVSSRTHITEVNGTWRVGGTIRRGRYSGRGFRPSRPPGRAAPDNGTRPFLSHLGRSLGLTTAIFEGWRGDEGFREAEERSEEGGSEDAQGEARREASRQEARLQLASTMARWRD